MAPSCVVLHCDDVTVKCTKCIVIRTQKKHEPTCVRGSVQLLDFSRKRHVVVHYWLSRDRRIVSTVQSNLDGAN